MIVFIYPKKEKKCLDLGLKILVAISVLVLTFFSTCKISSNYGPDSIIGRVPHPDCFLDKSCFDDPNYFNDPNNLSYFDDPNRYNQECIKPFYLEPEVDLEPEEHGYS